MSETRVVSPASVVSAAVIDLVLVVVFVVIGRSSHDEASNFVGFVTTAWPFVAGVALGWLIMRAWRAPLGVVWTGIGIWISTVVFGMLLRSFADQGVQLSFVIVTVVVLGVFLLGWRGIVALVLHRRTVRS
ncbi:DUF3054 domain-containing protein [Leifsonia sp. A12D58]|uniref:DUF3054 domain-containing protein n=1 Tax=Leifsonia sp. A12D58 TaxID=3397674 RepID=UPI0039DFAADD